MVETDWQEILSYSQRELAKADKEKLCENLSWMEADDIELNFTDLKTLFRLAQDILKYKSEQVNNLLGQLETAQKKSGKGKLKGTFMESPTRSNDSVLDTIAHQEEVIKANKEILEQLYVDIAELEGKKKKLESIRDNLDQESESSRDVLSEMNAMAQLENEITLKNRHVRKLLTDVKILEEENTKLKEKVSVLKDKLTEATELIETLTDQLFTLKNENSRLKDILGKSEQAKAKMTMEIEDLKQQLIDKESAKEDEFEAVRAKILHWKNIAKSKKAELESLFSENSRLKENLAQSTRSTVELSPKKSSFEVKEEKIKELQEKLIEASNKMIESANIIELLKDENKQLKSALEESHDLSMSDAKNESDDGKERALINKLRKKVKSLTLDLQAAEGMVAAREKELSEIAAQLELVKTDEGINALLEGLKHKKRKLKLKDEGIKSLVQEVNSLNHSVENLQLENESLRQKCNIPMDEKIPVTGILKKYQEIEQQNTRFTKEYRKLENKLLHEELLNRNLNTKVKKLINHLSKMGCLENKIEEICKSTDEEYDAKPNDRGDAPDMTLKKSQKHSADSEESTKNNQEINTLIEENEGLRRGLQEILNFLKDNSTTTSGVLALQCPSLESLLHLMEARHSAGWLAPHMRTVMELKAALGGKDALLTALHEARKETNEVMTKLSKETLKSQELEQKLIEIESKSSVKEEKVNDCESLNLGEFGSWMGDNEQYLDDFTDINKIEDIFKIKTSIYENQLRNGLLYFNIKYKLLFDKMTTISVHVTDEQNKWLLQEEKYKAEIENLKQQINQNEDEDGSDISPGIIDIPNIDHLLRKCRYLEESYKSIRTLNENLRNECLEAKKDAMVRASEYETDKQKLMFNITNLTEKLRSSISFDVFWKQNAVLNELITRNRILMENQARDQIQADELVKRLENNKSDILNSLKNSLHNQNIASQNCVEHTVLNEQLQQICKELDEKNKIIENLQKTMASMQESQSRLVDESLASLSKEETGYMKEQIKTIGDENKILREQCLLVQSQLETATLQLGEYEQRQMNNDIEINMLRHQILDLQSVGDNKAVVARLSGEVLVAHLQASENHRKIERLIASLNKEKLQKAEAEEMLKTRQKLFDIYSYRYETKFRYMHEVLQVLRQQYHGSIPSISVENYLSNIEDLTRKTYEVNEKLNDIENIQFSLMTKHSLCDQILSLTKNKCVDRDDRCPHKVQNIILENSHAREKEHYTKKLNSTEESYKEILKRCNKLEKTLLLVNQSFERSITGFIHKKNGLQKNEEECKLQVEDIDFLDESEADRNQTKTLTEPRILKQRECNIDINKTVKVNSTPTHDNSPCLQINRGVNVALQTTFTRNMKNIGIQTEKYEEHSDLQDRIIYLENEIDKTNKELHEAIQLTRNRAEEAMKANHEKNILESKLKTFEASLNKKSRENEMLQTTLQDLRHRIDELRDIQHEEQFKAREITNINNQSLINAMKQFELDKNAIIAEYKELLNNEREEYSNTMKDYQAKIKELQAQINTTTEDTAPSNSEAVKEVISKYTAKIAELEEKCFKLQNETDGNSTQLSTYQSEVERWKLLASERLAKMEQLSSQLEERHNQEVQSYKAENEHWISQLNDTQREHIELRTRLSEQKASYIKQLADKDAHIEHLRSIVHGLKTQMVTMQTMISVNDPSFDLSAIVEVEEGSEALSTHGSERLELKYDSSVDFHETDDLRLSASSSNIWQEPLIERLRRERQLMTKQNAMLRRQIKALAARERRARLDAQNLKNQVFRISTSGNKVVTAETAALHNKIASLQTQLMNARRDTHSTVALWDKWKRAQQASERWQARYEEKCQEVKKSESCLAMAKSAVARLEKEKRILLQRLNEEKSEKMLVLEKQDSERSEKPPSHRQEPDDEASVRECSISTRALLDRVQAQQRRIVALETADKGNEHLVSEYEKALAEITSLKGQVLKLESTILESEIKMPLRTNDVENKTELEYWKSYCEMLKEENIQLNLKVNTVETHPASAHQQRINDLEQTILTLRGLVSKLQSENKSGVMKRPDSRPSSVRSIPDKNRTQLESYRTEINNLKRSIQDKDLLLERSKEMLKIAAEREDDLLRENTALRRQIIELTTSKQGFLSA